MPENYERKISVEDLRDAQVAEATKYLDPDLREMRSSAKGEASFVICLSLQSILAGIVAYGLFYLPIS